MVQTAQQVKGLGFQPQGGVHRNLVPAALYEAAIARKEATISASGALVALTGKHTGRSAKDKFLVEEASSKHEIWWGDVNQSISTNHFNALKERLTGDLAKQDLFVFDGYAGADQRYRLKIRVVTPFAWHCLFASNMLIREYDPIVLAAFEPDFTIYHHPNFQADPAKDGTRSETFILASFEQRTALIGGTHYAGEIKKTVFTVMNRLLPKQGILSMHCSANYGKTQDDVALFFGLSGTGKTTLSADASRHLIGDDEHGWSSDGVFNIEGGCYAKVIDLSPTGEPEIYAASHKFGTILENVVMDEHTRQIDFNDSRYAQNTRSAYPVHYIPNMDADGVAGHPKNVVFLTADAFGVLPPIARLSKAQAMYHYLSGYTAKVAGTEIGVTEPTATFSACFGAPFLPLHPNVYAELFGQLLAKHQPDIWLINTGWTGGSYGVGSRIKLSYTRRLVNAALSGELKKASYVKDPIFGLEIPTAVDGVPAEILQPRASWPDKAAYDQKATEVAAMFNKNFAKYADVVSAEVKAAAPKG